MSQSQIVERFLHGRRIRLLVKDPREYLQSHWVRGEIYEDELYGNGIVRHALGSVVSRISRSVRGHERKGMLGFIGERYRKGTFLDVGSCIGNHSLFFAIACDAERVISFEPVPELAAHQREVLELNGLKQVELIEAAVGDRPGTARFRRASAGNAGMGRVTESGDLEVRVTTIDETLRGRELPPVRLVKLDVEGYNVPALRGAREMLARDKPDVFVECETRDELAKVEGELARFSLQTDIVFNKTPTYLFVPRG